MKNKTSSKIFKFVMKVLPICAMAMTVISANATACWMHGQEKPPVNLRKYRKF